MGNHESRINKKTLITFHEKKNSPNHVSQKSIGDPQGRPLINKYDLHNYKDNQGSVNSRNYATLSQSWFCPGVPKHKGITIVRSLFVLCVRSYCLAAVYCWFLVSTLVHPGTPGQNPKVPVKLNKRLYTGPL